MPETAFPPISIEIVSDDDEDFGGGGRNALITPPFESHLRKKPRFHDPSPPATDPPVFVIDDDPTPQKPPASSLPEVLLVPDTPLSRLPDPGDRVPIFVRCRNNAGGVSDLPQVKPSPSHHNSSRISGLISLESDDEYEGDLGTNVWDRNQAVGSSIDERNKSMLDKSYVESMSFHVTGCSVPGNVDSSQMSGNSFLDPSSSQHDTNKANNQINNDNMRLEQVDDVVVQSIKVNLEEKKSTGTTNKRKTKHRSTETAPGRNRLMKEERANMMEEKKRIKEQEKLQKAILKAEAAEVRKLEKEKQKWEKGKLATKSIVAEIDTKVVEGSVGGHLLSRFTEKGLTFRLTSNPIERSILWTMNVPLEISQLSSKGTVIPYVSLVYGAEEFCNILLSDSIMDHVSRVKSHYPSYTVCCLTYRVMAFINKREQAQYKNPGSTSAWSRPPVEEAMAKLATHVHGVHSRLCIDEAELAEHVVGLTSSLAACQFRNKLTRLSVNANGSLIPKDCIDRNLIKKSVWLKALVAIPKVQPRFAIAIWKKYPTMKSLLSVYMDPRKSVHEKEFLLKDLTTEGLLRDDRRLGEICSKRVYRVLMAQSGIIRTDDVEDGADLFT